MTFKTTLNRALEAADDIVVDNCAASAYWSGTGVCDYLALADETEVSIADQEIEIANGSATFLDTDGEEHDIYLTMVRQMTEADIKELT